MVSPMTVRRDLQILEDQGYLIRTHGGAVANDDLLIKEVSYQEKAIANVEIKQRIALAASKLVKPGHTIILDAGTTNMQLAKLLAETQNLKIVTNDILIAAYLYPYKNIQVYCCSGIVQPDTGCLVGSNAIDFFANILADMVFLGASAFDLTYGVTTPTLDKARLKQQMLMSAKKKILMCDSSKYGKESFAKICSLHDLDRIITDKEFTPKGLKSLAEQGVYVDTV